MNLDGIEGRLARIPLDRPVGRVTRVLGNLVESDGPDVALGDLCRLEPGQGAGHVPAEVVGFHGRRILLMPLAEMLRLDNRTLVVPTGSQRDVPVGMALVGRVIDGLGRPMDDKGPLSAAATYPLHAAPPPPLARRRITEPRPLGIRAIDAFALCGRGQRVGIFAAAGVGKSTLLGMMARGTAADVNVIALIGERGREVLDFIERDLGPDGMARSVVVVATSAEPSLLRVRAAFLATALAEYFRDQGRDVLLMMDSLTRFALAQRDIGLAVGEQPTTRGFTPSVFTQLPRLLERSGAARCGSITGLYTVLVEGNDPDEPVADTVRSILDGHLILSRQLAEAGQYPAIDVSASLSRLMRDVAGPEHLRAADRFRKLLAAYRDVEDLVLTGSYRPGSNARADEAIARRDAMRAFLCQDVTAPAAFDDTLARLRSLFEERGVER